MTDQPATDPLSEHSDARLHWTTANIGEGLPGVLTPLGWSLWGPVADRSIRAGWHAIGILEAAEVDVAPADRLVRVFHGRAALLVDELARVGDRMPGTSAEKVVRGVFGEMPATITPRPTRRRYPHIAVRMPWQFLTSPRKLRAAARDTETWWSQTITGVDSLTHEQAQALFG
jgi:hypothetical protein